MEYLQSGIPVRYLEKGEERSGIVYLADYSHPENNSFIVANQWTFIENSNKRPDIILFLNGLPVVLVELKSPSREETDASEPIGSFGIICRKFRRRSFTTPSVR